MQQLIDVQTVIKSAALISTLGAIAIPHAWSKAQESGPASEKTERRRWRGGMSEG